MATKIIMPRQGQSVESCIITKRFVEEGEMVSPGDLLFAYETDKASFEEESEIEGVLLKWLYDEGDEVEVLKDVCIIGKEGEELEGEAAVSANATTGAKATAGAKATEDKKTTAGEEKEDAVGGSETDDIKVSPRARKMAEGKGIDLKLIKGSGPGGRIIVRDIPEGEIVASVIPVSTGASNDYKDEPLSNIRKIIAKAMYNSLQNSAQLTHHLGADARRILEMREEIKKNKEKAGFVNITINDMVCFAIIKALKKYPRINSHLSGDTLRMFADVNLGFAVDTERGLMVPVIKAADMLSIEGISKTTSRLAAECRSAAIDPDLIMPEAASFTVSNLGNYGVEMFTPVINLPQTAILGVNTIVPRPADLGGGVYGFVPYIGLSLTYDHRAIDGGEATRFLKQIADEIKNLEF